MAFITKDQEKFFHWVNGDCDLPPIVLVDLLPTRLVLFPVLPPSDI